MELKEQLEAIIDLKPGIDLEPGEWCFYKGKAEFGSPVEKVTTKKKPGIGVVVPVTKHLGVGIGKSRTKTKREIVWNKTKCKIYLTNERFCVEGKKKVLPFNLENFVDIRLDDDHLILFDAFGPSYFFMSKGELKRFQNAWNLVREANTQKLDLSTLDPHS